jgi:hypothetical protein
MRLATRFPAVHEDSTVVVYALLLGVAALCTVSIVGAIFDSHRRRS